MLKTLIKSVIIVTVAFIVLYVVFIKLGLKKELAIQISLGFYVAVLPTHIYLEKRLDESTLKIMPSNIVAPNQYLLPWYLLLIYSTIILQSSTQILAFLHLFSCKHPPEISFYFLVMLIAFKLGEWIGARNKNKGIMILLLSTFIPRLFSFTMDFVFLYPESNKTIFDFVIKFFSEWVLFLVPAGYGFYLGNKRRSRYYLDYLVKRLPNQTQSDLIRLVYEEVKSVSNK